MKIDDYQLTSFCNLQHANMEREKSSTSSHSHTRAQTRPPRVTAPLPPAPTSLFFIIAGKQLLAAAPYLHTLWPPMNGPRPGLRKTEHKKTISTRTVSRCSSSSPLHVSLPTKRLAVLEVQFYFHLSTSHPGGRTFEDPKS